MDVKKLQTRHFKILVSLIFGLIGFFSNFIPLDFNFDELTASFLLGIGFPLVISQVWGWKYGLLSATLGMGCQSMWFIWTSGYGMLVSVPFFTLWVVWHGFFAELKRNSDKKINKFLFNPYIIEIPFRVVNVIILNTLFPHLFQFNPPFWCPQCTLTFCPPEYCIFIAYKEVFNAYLVLVLCNALIQFGPFRKLLKLEKNEYNSHSTPIITIALLVGLMFWLIETIFDYYLFYPGQFRFVDLFILEIPVVSLTLRISFFIISIISGLIVSSFISHRIKIETREKSVLEELADVQAILYSAIEQFPVGFLLADYKSKIITDCNKVAEEILDIPRNEILNESILFDEHPINKMYSGKNSLKSFFAIESGFFNREIKIKSQSGENRWLVFNGTPVYNKRGEKTAFILSFSDITNEKLGEEENIKNIKMESIGLLAGGIAHDFNNLLMAISGSLSLLRESIKVDEEEMSIFKEAEDAAMRAKDLAHQLLTFSKGGTPRKEISSINEVIEKSAKFAMHGSNVALNLNLPDETWPVNIDKGQISQVIQNLVINAVQAIYNEDGMITILSKNVELMNNNPLRLKNGKYVKIEVKDNGCGIPETFLPKIFDPYFTTKADGSGLGLSVCHSIVKKHQGSLRVFSQVNKGTTFIIHLPANPESIPIQHPKNKEIQRGSGRILILEDEKSVSRVLKAMLKRLNYNAVITEEGQGTIMEYQASLNNNNPFDVVILDLTIPGGLGGLETMKILLDIDPNVKAIVSSGYGKGEVLGDPSKYGFKGLLPKPYTISDLSQILNRIMKK